MENALSNRYQKMYVRRYTLTEGKEAGIKVIEIDNGLIRALLNENHALDVMQLFYKGVNIAFVSKNGFQNADGSFADRFEGGLLYTVGLDSAGVRDGHPVHGSLHMMPSKITSIVENNKEIRVTGEITDTSLFGKNLLLRRTYILKANSRSLALKNELINMGTKDSEYCILFHNNFGYPLLNGESEILVNWDSIEPRNTWSMQKQDDLKNVYAPIDNEDETCYFLNGVDGKATLQSKGLSITIEYSKDTLPEFVLWKSMASQDYAVGFEPSTTKLDDKFHYSIIKAKETIVFDLKYKIGK